MARRSIRAYCPRCRHQQPFVRACFDWKLHGLMTVLTLGIWLIVAISSAIKRTLWPWQCEHCGWHEPDFRSPEERNAGGNVRLRSGSSSSRTERKDGAAEARSESSSGGPPQPV